MYICSTDIQYIQYTYKIYYNKILKKFKENTPYFKVRKNAIVKQKHSKHKYRVYIYDNKKMIYSYNVASKREIKQNMERHLFTYLVEIL